MAKHESKAQKETVERVMHEYKHGELKRGPDGKGGKVKSRKQAIAIALHEAGASNQESAKKNKQNLRKTKAKERKGETAMQEKEGKGAMRKLENSRAKKSGGKSGERGKTKAELYAQARKRDIPGRSKMNKAQLERALHA